SSASARLLASRCGVIRVSCSCASGWSGLRPLAAWPPHRMGGALFDIQLPETPHHTKKYRRLNCAASAPSGAGLDLLPRGLAPDAAHRRRQRRQALGADPFSAVMAQTVSGRAGGGCPTALQNALDLVRDRLVA